MTLGEGETASLTALAVFDQLPGLVDLLAGEIVFACARISKVGREAAVVVCSLVEVLWQTLKMSLQKSFQPQVDG